MTVIKKVFAWLVFSSKNSAKISLSVKSALTFFVTMLTVWAGFAHIQLPTEALTQAVDDIIVFIQTAFLLISTASTIWGLLRKVWTSITGSNAVVNEHEVFNR